MMLTWHPTTTCILCGGRLEGIYVASPRVNKRSLKMPDRGGLMCVLPKCRECGTKTDGAPIRWALDDESAAKVAAYRERKWGAVA